MVSIYRKLREKIDYWLTYESPPNEVMPYDFNRLKYEIKPGDVLLFKGTSRIATVIRTITQSPWTHAALYIGRLVDFEDDALQAIVRKHTDAKETTRLLVEDLLDRGTVITPLNYYHLHHIRICRPIGITPSDLQLVMRYAIRSLGQPYNVRHFIDLARFILPWSILPRRWGSSIFRTPTGDPEPGVCSSLIAEAFSSVQFPILPFVKPHDESGYEVFDRNPYLFTPKDFDYSPYFEIIKFPLFNPDEPLPYYRRMPWTKTGLLHQDYGVLSVTREAKKKKKLKSFVQDKEKTDEENPSTPTDLPPPNDQTKK